MSGVSRDHETVEATVIALDSPPKLGGKALFLKTPYTLATGHREIRFYRLRWFPRAGYLLKWEKVLHRLLREKSHQELCSGVTPKSYNNDWFNKICLYVQERHEYYGGNELFPH